MSVIESLFETYRESVFQKNVESYGAIFDDDVLIFDMWAEWRCSGLNAWREMAKDWFTSLGRERVIVTFDEIQIRDAGELALATAFVRFAAISEKGEELRFLQNRLTWVIQKKKGTWKVIHQHTSVPIDFGSMKGMLIKATEGAA